MKIAICYHYLALYRLPIFHQLVNSDVARYEIFSGTTSDDDLQKIDPRLSTVPLSQGGLRWAFLRNHWLMKKRFLWQSGLFKVVMDSSFDAYIFLGSPYHISTWACTLIANFRGKKTFFWMHGVNSTKPSFKDKMNIFLFYRLPHGFFLYGNRAKLIMSQFSHLSKKQTYVIFNSLDYDQSKRARQDLSIEDFLRFRVNHFEKTHLPIVIAIGRVNKIKRLDLLLEVNSIHKTETGQPLFNFLVVGDGSELDHLKRFSGVLGLDTYTKFFGACYDEEINGKLIMHSDLCVVPGEIGLTSIHSLSFGTPVISHNNLNIQAPEVESIIPGKTGDFYEFANIKDLRRSISDWFTKYPHKSKSLMSECYSVIDSVYNPEFQMKVFNSAFH